MAREVLNSGVHLGYDGVANALRSTPEQNYQVWFDAPATWDSLRRESIQAALNIRKSTDKEIVVLYSGGLDSEWTMESFRLAGVAVTALCVVYKNGLNAHDVGWARAYLDRTQHKSVIWHEFDLADYYKSEAQKTLAWNVQTPELAYTAQYQSLLDNRTDNRVFITSYDEPLVVANDAGADRIWEVTYSERHYSVVKFFEQYQIDGCSNWSRQSPELFASYVTQPQWQLLVSNMYGPMNWHSEMIKIPMFQYAFPTLAARPKYTGFEGSLDFVVEGSTKWKQYLMEQTQCKWLQDYRENIHSIWAKLGVNKRG